jgi:hypothetical protein
MSPFLTTLGGGSVRGFGRSFRRTIAGPVQGQQAYTTAGTYTFVVPAGITSISAVCVGSGANGTNGNGGWLSYSNSVAVTPAESLTVVVGAGGTVDGNPGNLSSIARGATDLVRALGGGLGGTNVGDVSNYGGDRGGYTGYSFMGGGGAGGYSGAGGMGGGNSVSVAGTGGAGGGGGRGGETNAFFIYDYYGDGLAGGGGGGGVGILGTGSSGAGGSQGGSESSGGGGGGAGSSGSSGGNGGASSITGNTAGNGGVGGAYGGAGGGYGQFSYYTYNVYTGMYYLTASGQGTNGNGAVGAVRIIWGAGRSYPSAAANV